MRVVTVGDIVGGGFRLVRAQIAALAIWALLYLAMTVAMFYAIRPFLRGIIAAQAGGAVADPVAMLGGMGQMFGIYLLLLLGVLVLYTAALRSALCPEQRAFAYLRLGMDEVRMLAVAAILLIGFTILYCLLAVVATLVAAAIGVMAHGAIVPVAVLLMLLVFCVLIVVQVRFSLAFALTVLRRQICIGESWSLTKGRFWTLFGAYFVVVLIVGASAMLIFAINAGPYWSDIAKAGASPAALHAAQQQQLQRQFGALTPLTVVGWALGAVLGAFWITLGAGVASTAVTALRDDAFADVGAIYE